MHHMCSGAHGGQRKLLDPLEQELHMAVNPMWILGTDPRSSIEQWVLLTAETPF